MPKSSAGVPPAFWPVIPTFLAVIPSEAAAITAKSRDLAFELVSAQNKKRGFSAALTADFLLHSSYFT